MKEQAGGRREAIGGSSGPHALRGVGGRLGGALVMARIADTGRRHSSGATLKIRRHRDATGGSQGGCRRGARRVKGRRAGSSLRSRHAAGKGAAQRAGPDGWRLACAELSEEQAPRLHQSSSSREAFFFWLVKPETTAKMTWMTMPSSMMLKMVPRPTPNLRGGKRESEVRGRHYRRRHGAETGCPRASRAAAVLHTTSGSQAKGMRAAMG